jgi:malate dehydrogenase (oxaloacetate-decarboxylating)
MSPAKRDKDASLLPPLGQIRAVSAAVAAAAARQAQADSVADPCDSETLERRLRAQMWSPNYRPFVRGP